MLVGNIAENHVDRDFQMDKLLEQVGLLAYLWGTDCCKDFVASVPGLQLWTIQE